MMAKNGREAQWAAHSLDESLTIGKSCISSISCLPFYFSMLCCPLLVLVWILEVSKILLRSPGWPWTHHIDLVDFELSVLLSSPLECWAYGHVPPYRASFKFLKLFRGDSSILLCPDSKFYISLFPLIYALYHLAEQDWKWVLGVMETVDWEDGTRKKETERPGTRQLSRLGQERKSRWALNQSQGRAVPRNWEKIHKALLHSHSDMQIVSKHN